MFIKNLVGFILLVFLTNAGGEVTVYNPDGNIYTFSTIQAGIDACPEGGTVYVSAGTYNEAVYINK